MQRWAPSLASSGAACWTCPSAPQKDLMNPLNEGKPVRIARCGLSQNLYRLHPARSCSSFHALLHIALLFAAHQPAQCDSGSPAPRYCHKHNCLLSAYFLACFQTIAQPASGMGRSCRRTSARGWWSYSRRERSRRAWRGRRRLRGRPQAGRWAVRRAPRPVPPDCVQVGLCAVFICVVHPAHMLFLVGRFFKAAHSNSSVVLC